MIISNRVEKYKCKNNVYSENEYYKKLLEFCLKCGVNNLLCPEVYKIFINYIKKILIKIRIN
jgi:ferredoxin-like protein FixX